MDWAEPSKLRFARRLAAALGYIALNASNRLYVWPLSASTAAYGLEDADTWAQTHLPSSGSSVSSAAPSQTHPDHPLTRNSLMPPNRQFLPGSIF